MWGTRAPPEWLPAGDRVAAFWSQAWRLGDNHHSLPRESSYSDIRSEELMKMVNACVRRDIDKHAAGVSKERYGDIYFKTQLGRFDIQELRSDSAHQTMRHCFSQPHLHRHSFDTSTFLPRQKVNDLSTTANVVFDTNGKQRTVNNFSAFQ
jgi:hypothetical protein